MNVKCEEKFEIASFIVARVKCRLVIYPNGDKPELEGYFILHLHMDLPEYIDTITFCRLFRVKECYTSSAWLTTLSNGEYEYWTRHCPLQDIKMNNPLSLNIEIELNIHEITLKDNVYSSLSQCKLPDIHPKKAVKKAEITYILEGKELEMCRKCKQGGKSICSDGIDNMWILDISPKEQHANDLTVRLRMLYIPSDYESVNVKYSIQLVELGDFALFESQDTFHRDAIGWGAEFFMAPIQGLKQVTFKIELEIQSTTLYPELSPLTIDNPSDITYLLS